MLSITMQKSVSLNICRKITFFMPIANQIMVLCLQKTCITTPIGKKLRLWLKKIIAQKCLSSLVLILWSIVLMIML